MKRLLPLARLLACLTIAWLFEASVGAAWAGPSDSLPEAGLEVRPFDAASDRLAVAAQRLYEQARRDVDRYRASQQKGTLAGENPIAIGATFVSTLQLHRTAEHLKLRGEAAGYDYALRSTELQQQTRELAQQYATLGRFSGEQLAARMEGLKRSGVARLPQVRSLAAAARFEAADALMNGILDSLHQFAVFLGGNAAAQYFQPFSSLDGDIKAKVVELRREAAHNDLLAMRSRIDADGEAVLARCRAAVDQVALRGVAAWVEPGEATGPELVSRFVEEWRQSHLAARRSEALEWSWGGSPQPIRRAELDSLRAAQGDFSNRMLDLIAALIAADAKRTNPDSAALLHAQYVRELAAIAATAPRAELIARCEAPLAALIEKAPRLKDRVERYRAASAPLLFWRRRVAEAYATRSLATCAPLPVTIAASSTVDAGQAGLIPSGIGMNAAAMISPAPAVLRRLSPTIAATPASAADLRSTGGEGSPLAARYHDRTLAIVVRPSIESLAAARQALAGDLWEDRRATPLTLEAAIALHTSQRGDFTRAGGQITSLSLSPLLAHSIGAHDGFLAHLSLGPLPEEPENLDLTSHVLVKATIAPAWVQHEAFFVRLK